MTVSNLERKLKPYESPVKNPFSKWLYNHFPPRPITHKKMYDHYREAVRILMLEMGKKEYGAILRKSVEDYLRSVLPFMEAFEKKEHPPELTTPEDVFSFLMEQKDMSQYDIASEVGGQPVVSDILNGRRKLTRDHIERLSKRFGVSPATFFSC